MQRVLPATGCEPRRRCPGPCSTSYATPLCLIGRASRPWRTVARASNPSSVFELVDRQFADMERQFESTQMQIDRDIGAALSRARAAERQADADLQRALSRSSAGDQRSSFFEELRPAPNVDIQRREERAPGMYRYYERIQIGGGGGRASYISQPPPAAATSVMAPVPSFNPAFVGALVLAGGYLTLTAAFNRNYPLTCYAESKRWLLLALWPLLFLFSAKFREQFGAAIRGERVTLRREGGGAGGGGGSGGAGSV